MEQRCSAVIIGVGPERGLGATLARRFAANGLHIFLAGRSEDKLQKIADGIASMGGQATVVVADAGQEHDISHLFDVIDCHDSALRIAAYNVDSNVPMPILETEEELFTELWRQNCLGAFLFAKEAIKAMLPHKQGTLFFTGATASLRARPPFTAFSSAKAGQRFLAQGLAREFGPQGIHVVHTVIDGVIDGERAERQFPDYVKAKGKDGLLQLEAIADSYWAMHEQHPSAWTHELDLRPYKESF